MFVRSDIPVHVASFGIREIIGYSFFLRSGLGLGPRAPSRAPTGLRDPTFPQKRPNPALLDDGEVPASTILQMLARYRSRRADWETKDPNPVTNLIPSKVTLDWQMMQSGDSAQNPVAPPLVESPMRSASSQCLRHGRPSLWANTESSRITVAECFGCPIWIIANRRCSTASVRQPRAAFTSTPSISSSPGTAPNLDWPSTASSSCAIACTWNRGGLAANTINQQLAAVRRLAHEAADSGLLSPELAAGISRVKGVKQLGFRSGNWLSAEQSSEVLKHACGDSMRAKRDYAMLAMLFGCGFRRSELVGLELDEIQMRQGHWAVVDLIGKGGHIRTVPIPEWVKAALDQWIVAARVTEGRIFRAVARAGKVWGKGISQNVVWYVVKTCCERAGLEHIAPHDLRRTCAKLCHTSGGELEQIQFLLGHASVQTTERYLGCKQNLGHPVNDLFDLRTDGRPHENDDESGRSESHRSCRNGISGKG